MAAPAPTIPPPPNDWTFNDPPPTFQDYQNLVADLETATNLLHLLKQNPFAQRCFFFSSSTQWWWPNKERYRSIPEYVKMEVPDPSELEEIKNAVNLGAGFYEAVRKFEGRYSEAVGIGKLFFETVMMGRLRSKRRGEDGQPFLGVLDGGHGTGEWDGDGPFGLCIECAEEVDVEALRTGQCCACAEALDDLDPDDEEGRFAHEDRAIANRWNVVREGLLRCIRQEGFLY